jgi:formate hydrogenlyase subunit 3/multisubunit Na+/H+ antiporter MnhD subunit
VSTLFLVTAVFMPALLAGLCALPGPFDRVAVRLAPLAAVPALILAALPLEYPGVVLRWLLLGTAFELDLVGRIFLLVAAALWAAAGAFAHSYLAASEQRRFYLFFLLAMTGNLGLPIAADVIGFYFFFALMTFAGYGMVVHSGSAEARRAGRVYLSLAVVGEAFLLAGLLMGAQAGGALRLEEVAAGIGTSATSAWIIASLLVGFGIKAGAVPLHVWLPLAHPVAPTPASAVLSGCMIKAGLLGWLRLLPLGSAEATGWGTLLITLGVAAAFFGVLVGLVQTDPKTVLAYSSISQMGLMNVAVGIALAVPDAALPAVAAVTWYAAHHGLAKGALFLGVGVSGRTPPGRFGRALLAAGLALPALAIAGAPLTSGSIAKANLKELVGLAPLPWAGWLEPLLMASAAATTLLMARFLQVLFFPARPAQRAADAWMLVPWCALLIGVASLLVALPRWYPLGDPAAAFRGPFSLAIDILPIAGGSILFWLVVLLIWRPAVDAPPLVGPGDMLNPLNRLFEPIAGRLWRALHWKDWGWAGRVSSLWYRVYAESDRHDLVLRMELALTRWRSAVFFLLMVSAAMLWLFVRR